MDGCRLARKQVPTAALILALAGCGGDDEKAAAPRATPSSELVERCSLTPADGAGGFPAGLLPPGAVVTAEGTAIADGKLAEVFGRLKSRPGFEVRDSELETLDAELELEGAAGEASLALELAPRCARATQITLR